MRERLPLIVRRWGLGEGGKSKTNQIYVEEPSWNLRAWNPWETLDNKMGEVPLLTQTSYSIS